MRGTLHLLPVRDLGLWVGAQGALRPRYEQPAWLRHFGLTRAQAEAHRRRRPARPRAAAELTRDELADAVARGPGTSELAASLRRGFGDLLKPAAFRGDLCFAPGDGPRVRFARPAAWLGAWAPAGRATPRAEVARRYLPPTGRRRASGSSAGSA